MLCQSKRTLLHPTRVILPDDIPPRLELAQHLHREQRMSLGVLEQRLSEVGIEQMIPGSDQALDEITTFGVIQAVEIEWLAASETLALSLQEFHGMHPAIPTDIDVFLAKNPHQ